MTPAWVRSDIPERALPRDAARSSSPKGRRADLDAAFEQLRQYSLALENPPRLIASDMVRFRIRTN